MQEVLGTQAANQELKSAQKDVSARMAKQFFQQEKREGRPTLLTNEQADAVTNGYAINFGEPVCKAVQNGFGSKMGGWGADTCDYYPYAHRQITMIPRGQFKLSDVVDRYSTHVRSPRLKNYEWLYYEHDLTTRNIVSKSKWNASRDPEAMKVGQPYWITKCLGLGAGTACNSYRYKIVKLDDATFALITVANNPASSKSCEVASEIKPSFTRKYLLRGYTSITLIRDMGDQFMIADVGDGYSTDSGIINLLTKPDNKALIVEAHRYDYEALSRRFDVVPSLMANAVVERRPTTITPPSISGRGSSGTR